MFFSFGSATIYTIKFTVGFETNISLSMQRESLIIGCSIGIDLGGTGALAPLKKFWGAQPPGKVGSSIL